MSASPPSSPPSSPPRVTYRVEQHVAILTINNPPVNSYHPLVQSGLDELYQQACADAQVKAVVVTGAGPMFMAGADIERLRAMQNDPRTTRSSIIDWVKRGDRIFGALESGPKPTVAALNGSALGGGLELALSCNARLTVPNASLGLPELTLGIIPGLGGTQRLPRIVGVEKAVQMMLTSKPLKAADAFKAGLVHAVVKDKELLPAAIKLALDIAANKVPRIQSLQQTRALQAGGATLEEHLGTLQIARARARAKNPLLPQPLGCLDAIQAGLEKGGAAGLQREAEVFADLIVHPVSRALVHFFFASRATTKLPDLKAAAASASSAPIQRVAVLGGGTMGAGICIAYLAKGYNVILKEINGKALAAGVERIVEQMTRVIKARKLPMNALEMMMRNLVPQTTYDHFDKVDLVIEAAVEKLQLKQQIFAELERVCSPTCILATNTSTIDIELIGAHTKAQSRIIGLHFFSPAHIMPLLEIIRTRHTAPDVVLRSLAMSKRIGKTPVVVGNCVGFAANRGFFPYGQAAALLVDLGLEPYRIDAALEKFGMPMGVFRMADLSGIDIFLHVSGTIDAAYGSRCYLSTLGQRMAEANRLGQKTGAGYYKYVKGKHVPDAKAIAPMITASRQAAGIQGKAGLDVSKFSDADIVEFVLFPVVNEFLRIVEEKFANSTSDIDVVSVMGYGFPSWRGGVLWWAQNVEAGGYKRVAQRLSQWAKAAGGGGEKLKNFFTPCALLQQLASK